MSSLRFDVGAYNREKYQCIWGHDFTESNTIWYTRKDGVTRRACRKCKQRIDRLYKRRVRRATRKAANNV